MAQIEVEKKKNTDWLKWVLGILAAIIVIWLIVEFTGTDDDVQRTTTTTTAYAHHPPSGAKNRMF